MKILTISCLVALAVSAQASNYGLGPVYAPGHASLDYYSYPRYAFEYSVRDPHTGDNKAQWEKRDGDVVRGAYSLVEPDGNLRTVEYWADDHSGFNAVVKRTGPNLHPTGIARAPIAPIAPVASIYRAPIPILESVAPVAPIHVGPVAGLSGLVDAPLLSGRAHGGAISSASIINHISPVARAPVAVAPIAVEPIGHGVGPIGHGVGPIGHGVGPIGHGVGPIGPGVGAIGHGVGYAVEPVGPIGHRAGPIGHGIASVGPIGHGIAPVGPIGHGVAPVGPIGHGISAVGPIGHGVGAIGHGAGSVGHGVGHGIASDYGNGLLNNGYYH